MAVGGVVVAGGVEPGVAVEVSGLLGAPADGPPAGDVASVEGATDVVAAEGSVVADAAESVVGVASVAAALSCLAQPVRTSPAARATARAKGDFGVI